MIKTFKFLFIVVLVATGCLTAPHAHAADKGRVKLVYVEWSSEVASTNVVKAVLSNLGYRVEALPVSAAAMWQAVATGAADGMVAAWLPTTHAQYLKAVKNKIVDLGPNLEGTRDGLVVPDYVTIDSIAQLNANAKKFDRKIIGIDPGAGLMSETEKVMQDYNLSKFRLVSGSGATMTAALADAIRTHSWIVVTGWTPHWMFHRWKLKYLKDPKKVYGSAGYIATIVRKGLKHDMPEVYRVLDNFHWTPADMESLMIENQKEGADPYANAQRWVKNHPQLVKQWEKK